MAEFKIYPSDKDFEKFWALYPKKRAKGDAKKAWHQTASIRPPVEQILNSIVVMCTSEDWQKSDGQYIPLPASFLRGERWDDVVEVQTVGARPSITCIVCKQKAFTWIGGRCQGCYQQYMSA